MVHVRRFPAAWLPLVHHLRSEAGPRLLQRLRLQAKPTRLCVPRVSAPLEGSCREENPKRVEGLDGRRNQETKWHILARGVIIGVQLRAAADKGRQGRRIHD